MTVGSPAQITTHAYPGRTIDGRVSYIDPQVSSETRTAKARIEVPNPRGDLRLGMYAEALFGSRAGASMPMVPRAAVQNVADRTVVYLVDPAKPGTFIEREMRLGAPSADLVSVLSGILNDFVTIEFTPGQAGEIAFACGMNMLRGAIAVR